jgi:hypothetical protein
MEKTYFYVLYLKRDYFKIFQQLKDLFGYLHSRFRLISLFLS